jgi:hypothetical protein
VNTKGKGTKTKKTKTKGSKATANGLKEGQGIQTRRKGTETGTGGMMTGRTGAKSKKGAVCTTDREEAKGHKTNKNMKTKPLTKYNLSTVGEEHNEALIMQIDKRTSTRNRPRSSAQIEAISDSDSTESASDVDDEWVPRPSPAKRITPDDPPPSSTNSLLRSQPMMTRMSDHSQLIARMIRPPKRNRCQMRSILKGEHRDN